MRDLLEKDLSVEVTALLASPTALVEHLTHDLPHVVITDYSMPGDETYGDGIRLVKFLTRRFPKTQVVVLTMVSNPMIISALYDAGVAAVVLKRDNLAEIVTALHTLQAGRKYYPRDSSAMARWIRAANSLANASTACRPRNSKCCATSSVANP
ncbi:Capsular synthesis regulator component B [Achromobacter denitrificans]|nr:Capsular synthesis regulator component B [Achromobacter denitrificans]